jgi:hypothetical protein
MRTKTIILSGLLAALSGASLMAQVYSLNAVGYINVDIPANNWSIIADQLYATNQQTSQTIDAILGPTLLSTNASGVGNYVGCIVFPYNNGTSSGSQAFDPAISIVQQPGQPPSWSSPNEATGTSFNPGQAVFIYNSGPDFQITFVGQVPQGTVTNVLTGGGFNLVSSIIPQTGAIDTVLGVQPAVGDIVFTFENGAYDPANIVVSLTGTNANWSHNASSTNTVGTGFFYYNASGTANNWVRTFTVNTVN